MHNRLLAAFLVTTSLLVGTIALRPRPAELKPGAAVRAAAAAMLGTLDTPLREKASFPFEDDERYNWHYFPRARKGLPLGAMNLDQRRAAHDLLRSLLSARGYLKATGIMQMEALLREMEQDSERRNPENYFFSFFGDPESDGPWGWRIEGHHLSVNYTEVEGPEVSVTPAFMGTNPAEVRSGPHAGYRVLGAEEDMGRALMLALTPEQQAQARIPGETPSDVVTGADRSARIDGFEGLPASEMTSEQTNLLIDLIRQYTHNMSPAIADARLETILDAGIEKVYFGWSGSVDPGDPHYYRVHGPTVLFEYDNVQNEANHAHAVWRDFNGDFGEDLLAKHYEEAGAGHGH